MGIDFSSEKSHEFQSRFSVAMILVILFFLIIVARLFYLQVYRGDYFRKFSAIHTLKEIKIPATRGVIYDRNKIPIAESRPSFDLMLVPQHVTDLERVKSTLQYLVDLPPDLVDEKWKVARHQPRYYPIILAGDISYDQAIKIRVAKSVSDETDDLSLNGVEVRSRPLRSYPQGPIAATTLGYIAEITESELKKSQKEKPGEYNPGDLVGATGLEKYWEKYLKGKDGYIQKIVDAAGREIISEELSGLLQNEDSHHGNNLVLTIDSRLQKFAEERFRGKSGGLVALDPRNGEILAMVSLPSYDPARLVSNVSHSYWADLSMGSGKVLLNRAIQGTYAPGSTYKIVTGIAALAEGIITEKDTVHCPGGFQYGGRFFKCWRHSGHGTISLHRAISESCDPYFYQLGLKLGADRMAKYANMLGMGVKSGIDLEGEKSGLIPTVEWKKRVLKQDWYPGENISISVGQGYDTATPLQNALMVAQVATGKKIRPHVMKQIENESGEVVKEAPVFPSEEIPISDHILKLVRAGMVDTIQSPSGTAHRSQIPGVKLAGKTGTAQVISEEGKVKARTINTGDHAWFVVYAPYEDPRIAVGVIVEHGGFGSTSAAPIASDLIKKFLEYEGLLPQAEPPVQKGKENG